jgi:hypothetical protein
MFTARAISSFSDDPANFLSCYKHQFQISVEEATQPPGWIRTDLRGICIDTAPDVTRTYLKSANDDVVALILGIAIDSDGNILEDTREISDADGSCSITLIEEFIESLAGRYLGVVSYNEHKRVYLDPVGDYSAVYNAESKISASTSLFAIDRDFIDNPDIPYRKVRTGQLNYSLGHTRDAKVRRQFANHYLDLTIFQQVRHWPKENTDLTTRDDAADISEIMDKITARLSSVFCEILRKKTCIVPLSGGRDSRCLVACGMPEIHRASTLFAWRFHRMSKWDTEIGSEIAESLDLPYKVFTHTPTTRDDKMLFLRRNGYNLFGPTLLSLAICESLPSDMVMTRGNVMGVLRATNWRGQTEGKLKIGHALRRLQMGNIKDFPDLVPLLQADIKSWHASLPDCGKLKVYDLLWFEVSLTHGQGTRNYGIPNNFVVNPFNDRLCLQLSMQLPLSLRQTDEAYDMILDRTAPDLKEFRYN